MSSSKKAVIFPSSSSNVESANCKVAVLITNIEKYQGNSADEQIHEVKYHISKLQVLLHNHDKPRADVLNKNINGVEVLCNILENSFELDVRRLILECFYDISSTGRRAKDMISCGLTAVLLDQLTIYATNFSENISLIVLVHSVFTRIGPKDRKFITKARLSGMLNTTVSLLRWGTITASALQSAVHVLKQLATNTVNASLLGKAGCLPVIIKLLSNSNRKHLVTMKLLLDALSLFTKSKSNGLRAVQCNGVSVLLRLTLDWQVYDPRNRQVSIRKGLLNNIKNLTNLKAGCRAVIDADGIKILYKLATDIIDVKEVDVLINAVTQIIRKVLPKHKLPLVSMQSSYRFVLPRNLSGGCAPSAADYAKDSDDDDNDILTSDDDDLDVETANISESLAGCEGEESEQGSAEGAVSKGAAPSDGFVRQSRGLDELTEEYSSFFPELVELSTDEQLNVYPDAPPPSEHFMTITPMPLIPRPSLSRPLSRTRTADPPGPRYRAASLPNVVADEPKSATYFLPWLNNKTGAKNKKYNLQSNKKGKSFRNQPKPPADTPEGLIEFPSTSSVTSDFDIESPSPYATPELYAESAADTRGINGPNRASLAELHGHSDPVDTPREPQHDAAYLVQRYRLLDDIDRFVNPADLLNRVVYDLDNPVGRVGGGSLSFNSRFESGNLRKVVWVREREYDLLLNADANTDRHHQWFYFEVSDAVANQPYRFNIINNEKFNSQFNFGMQPVVYSVRGSLSSAGGVGRWQRGGAEVCYYRNHFVKPAHLAGGLKGRNYYTTTFSVVFHHDNDVCYVAYHYPYTYTMLRIHLDNLAGHAALDRGIFYRERRLCDTLGGNAVPVVTVTGQPASPDELRSRRYVFLTSRVHPGESNASWVMSGCLNFLTSEHPVAEQLRRLFIFKLVPMLNPDGVVSGAHRVSLSGHDLNRCWVAPSADLHPTIYHTKGLLQYLHAIGRAPLVFCDFHGHSRKKNVFMYGNSLSQSWNPSDLEGSYLEDPGYRTLPRLLAAAAPAFSYSLCSFSVDRVKESSARVCVWRELGVLRSYTMEATYCGCDQGVYRGVQLGTRDLQETGRRFCEALLKLHGLVGQRKRADGESRGGVAKPEVTLNKPEVTLSKMEVTLGKPEVPLAKTEVPLRNPNITDAPRAFSTSSNSLESNGVAKFPAVGPPGSSSTLAKVTRELEELLGDSDDSDDDRDPADVYSDNEGLKYFNHLSESEDDG